MAQKQLNKSINLS